MEILKLKKNNTYNLKFVPNYLEPNKSVYELPIAMGNSFTTRYYSFVYDLNDKNIKTVVFGKSLFRLLQTFATQKCYYTDNNKLLYDLSYDKSTVYTYSIDENKNIKFYSKTEHDYINKNNEDNIEFLYDINKFDKPINIHDLSGIFSLIIDCGSIKDFMKIDNITINNMEPLFDGNNQKEVLKLYDNLPNLYKYVQYDIEELKNEFKNIVFYEEAMNKRKEIFNKRFKDVQK